MAPTFPGWMGPGQMFSCFRETITQLFLCSFFPPLPHCLAFSASILLCRCIGCIVFRFALFLKGHHSVLGHSSNLLCMAMLTSSAVVRLAFRNSKCHLDGYSGRNGSLQTSSSFTSLANMSTDSWIFGWFHFSVLLVRLTLLFLSELCSEIGHSNQRKNSQLFFHQNLHSPIMSTP